MNQTAYKRVFLAVLHFLAVIVEGLVPNIYYWLVDVTDAVPNRYTAIMGMA